MYEWVGKLFGMVIRSMNYLNLELAPWVWKLLLGDPISLLDIKDVDVATYNLITRDLDDMKEKGTVLNLAIGDEWIPAIPENRAKIEEYHLNKYNTQCEAIRRGMGCVVPIGLLSLFAHR